MNPVRTISLVLAVACAGVSPEAPVAAPEQEASLGDKKQPTLQDVVAQGKILQAQLRDALTQIEELKKRADSAEAALFLTDKSTGAQYSRVEALEGSLLEVDAAGSVVSTLTVDDKPVSPEISYALHYNKIKWTYQVQGKTAYRTLFSVDPDTNTPYDRIEALEQTLLPLDPKDGSITAKLTRHYNKIKWTYAAVGRVDDLDAAAAATAEQLVRLAAADTKFSNTDEALQEDLDALSGAMCSLSAASTNVLYGRWDGTYTDGQQPGFWTDLAIDTLDGVVTWESWVDRGFEDHLTESGPICASTSP